ncbi:hypothetical protein BKA70DRAFT_1435337 [Coprinopsis sp. MPI-PUGE-AT-0042]|nr:hypothetical protein BKA70DRAFT_1435337 [Coprinopsis sp. MPI-PUGE-AT-0042]
MRPSLHQPIRSTQPARRSCEASSRHAELLKENRRERIRRRLRSTSGAAQSASDVSLSASSQPVVSSTTPTLLPSPIPSHASGSGCITPPDVIPVFMPYTSGPGDVPGGNGDFMWLLETPHALCALWEKPCSEDELAAGETLTYTSKEDAMYRFITAALDACDMPVVDRAGYRLFL